MSIQNSAKTSLSAKKECCGEGGCGTGCSCNHCWGSDFVKKLVITLATVFLVYMIFFVGTLMRNNLKKFNYIGMADKMERTIMVSGYGKISGNNDIAMTTIGYSNTDKDVAKAQENNKKVMDQVMSELKKMGIAEKDLQSNYTIYPDYSYTPDKGQELKGYRVSNQLTIKIRDLSKITTILGLAGKYGATEIGGLNFTIDDPENLKSESRVKALADAKTKALFLANSLGVRLGGVVSYNEYESTGDFYNMKVMSAAEGGGMGGAPEAVAAGSKDGVMNVNVTYEILSR
ncbi:MAG: hypothetical protein US58_C0012G0044 [Candidatus Magasanikbacteria bacterium GW2011_GWA2_37_8]|uniref:26 kDa periplasmic immunogenic protein n=1 Tax=Candidatus Magasanikbacteria bacterium GW2011_GWA2_37_8 TaxID=1619036 RepID=A0A0G0HQD6_9BACT|nr:MAG: hypothetical protein US58_C0012G0044 [Candidatus Magasanikbacteria bacterium GW2011_GWA2_37_8]